MAFEFAEVGREAFRAFNSEIAPLHLPDEEFDDVVASSGLQELMDLLLAISDELGEVGSGAS